mmetsp:Transcript_5589/g.9242  ORF Transcript_5589/g.9242 Transcript_5589/m.9242 type:complete len:287 (+) Transcript_5589:1145-2005(+)
MQGLEPFKEIGCHRLVVVRSVSNTINSCKKHSVRLVNHLGWNNSRTVQQFKLLLSRRLRVVGPYADPLQTSRDTWYIGGTRSLFSENTIDEGTLPHVGVANHADSQGAILEASTRTTLLYVSASLVDGSMKGMNTLSVLGIHKQDVFDRRNGLILVFLGSILRVLASLLLILNSLIHNLGVDFAVPFTRPKGFVRSLPRDNGKFGNSIDMSQYHNAGSTSAPLSHLFVRGCLAGTSISDLNDDVDSLEGFRQLSLCLRNVTGVPIYCGSFVAREELFFVNTAHLKC